MRLVAAAGAAAAIVGATFLAGPALVLSLNVKVCDVISGWLPQGRPSENVLLVDIDDNSLARLGRWPWPRDVLAKVVNRVYDLGAGAVVLDMMFPEEESAAKDSLLAAALSRGPSVVGYSFGFEGEPGQIKGATPLALVTPADSRAFFFHATTAVATIPTIANACAGTGFLNASADPDGRLRVMPLIIEAGGRYYPSLGLAAWIAYRGHPGMRLQGVSGGALALHLNDRTVPLEIPSCLRVRFRSGEGAFPRVSAVDLVEGAVTANQLRGKVIVIGGTAQGLPASGTGPAQPRMPDHELQATVIDNLLQGDFIRRPGSARIGEVALAVVVALAAITLLTYTHSLWAFGAVVLVAFGVWPACALALSSAGILLSPLPATAALVIDLGVLTLFQYRRELRRAERTAEELASAREQTKEAIERDEIRYQRLVENINDAIIMNDGEERLVFANRRFREWFGIGDEAIGTTASETYVAPEWRPLLHDLHQRSMNGEPAPDHIEYEGVRPDGSRVWIEALITSVKEGDRIIGTQSALRDVTGRKRLESQFLQAQKMESVGRLAGGVAHDFNNLLTVINGYGEMLAMSLDETDKRRVRVEQILRAGRQAAELTQQLLAFSRQRLAKARPVDLNVLVAEAHNLLRRVVGEDIEVVSLLSPDLGQVMADPTQINQVLMNLVVNARDSMPQGGRITIETRNVEADDAMLHQHPELTAGSYVRLGVSDTGAGMTDEIKRQIFEPFFTTKEHGKGTGLGLATVYGIVLQSRGAISVWSEPGHGSVFHIYLPRLKDPAQVQEAQASPRLAELWGSETILLVEDQDVVRHLAGDILESYGYRVLQARSGPEAIALVQRYSDIIHLLLTDVILPRMNGREVAEALRAARPGLKVLYTSGYSEEVIGHLEHLPKPYTPEQLVAAVRKALQEPRSAAGSSAGE